MTSIMPKSFAVEDAFKYWSPNRTGLEGTYNSSDQANSSIVSADQDFGTCAEIYSNSQLQYLRSTTWIEYPPETYIQVRTRAKVTQGSKPTIYVQAYPRNASEEEVTDITVFDTSVKLTAYNQIYEISTIIGPSRRAGVGIVMDPQDIKNVIIGVNIVGGTGTVTRFSDFEFDIVTNDLVDQKLARLDVRDYGAVGDGSTDNTQAFRQASNAADGRTLFVPAGNFKIGNDLTIEAPIVFEGQLNMDTGNVLTLAKNFNVPAYVQAFGNNEQLGLEKALQSLLTVAGNRTLDFLGQEIQISRPVDVGNLVSAKTVDDSKARVLRNGSIRIQSDSGTPWQVNKSKYEITLSSVHSPTYTVQSEVQNIEVGSLISNAGFFGSEIYVTSVNTSTKKITTTRGSHSLTNGDTVQVDIQRFQYALDFSGVSKLNFFEIQDMHIDCEGRASGIMLPQRSRAFKIKNVSIYRPKYRGITSFDRGCQGLHISNCNFVSNEQHTEASKRETIAFNVNKNDAKITNCWAQQFRHFAVIGGQNNIITGCHFFQGGSNIQQRTAGIILTALNPTSTIAQNYVDNCFIDWSGEHVTGGDLPSNSFGFSGLSITGNIFLCSDVDQHFRFFKITPKGKNLKLSDLAVCDNVFRHYREGNEGKILRIDEIDKSYFFDNKKTVTVKFQNNVYNSIEVECHSPLTFRFEKTTASNQWTLKPIDKLKMPFDLPVRRVLNVYPEGKIVDEANNIVRELPYAEVVGDGNLEKDIKLNWSLPVKGAVFVTVAVDEHQN